MVRWLGVGLGIDRFWVGFCLGVGVAVFVGCVGDLRFVALLRVLTCVERVLCLVVLVLPILVDFIVSRVVGAWGWLVCV